MEYAEIQEVGKIKNVRKMSMRKFVDYLAAYNWFNIVLIIISQVLVAKPYSADVKRLISTINILKFSNSQSLFIETENKYLLVYSNKPLLHFWRFKYTSKSENGNSWKRY